MKKVVKLDMSFDKSVAPWIVKIAHNMGLYQCFQCKDRITQKNIGGIFNRGDKPELICKNILCLMALARRNNVKNN